MPRIFWVFSSLTERVAPQVGGKRRWVSANGVNAELKTRPHENEGKDRGLDSYHLSTTDASGNNQEEGLRHYRRRIP